MMKSEQDFYREQAEIERRMREKEEREENENPLLRFSTTQLKAELRRRKRE